MRLLDLFSGIGGFSLAARWAGLDTVQFVEYDSYCQKVLNKNFPGVPIHGDIKTFKGQPGSADIISGGFPCQPFSVAGQRRGAEDDRALWPEMFRIIKEVRPTWVVGENVTGIVNMELDNVLSDLEGEGYETQTFIIPACAVDAKHRRNRVWIVAHSDGVRRKRECGEEQKRTAKYGENVSDTRRKPTGTEKSRGNGKESCDNVTRCGEVVADTESVHAQGQHDGQGKGESGRGCRWPIEPNLGQVANGIPQRVDRLTALGNAIVPQVAYEIFRNIVK